MSINIWTDSMQHAALLGKPVLFTNWLIQRDIIPDGWYCYDLRGTHKSPSTRTTLVDHAADYHAGTVLSPIPLKHEGTASRRVNGTFYLLGEEMTLEQFCEEHDLAYPQDNREFVLRPASLDEVGLFYSEEKLDEALGTVGHLRMDFGHGEKEFWHTWWPHNEDRFNTPEFKEVLQRFVDDLRQTGLLKNLGAMDAYCWQHGGSITEDRRSYGYIAETENYRFCLRCTPFPGEYQGYLYCYDLCQQEMYRQEHPVVGRVTFASGEQQEFTDSKALLQAIREELPFRSTTGFRFETLTDDPEVKKAVDDILLDFAGEDNSRRTCNYGLTETGKQALIITTAYLRNEDIQTAVEENIDYLNPPVRSVFVEFLTRIKLVDPDVDAALQDMGTRIDNAVFREWVAALLTCRHDRGLKTILTPIVAKLSDMRIVNGELENLVFEPRKEFITMQVLVIGNIPLLYWLNQDWYDVLMHTPLGQALLAAIAAVMFISTAAVIKLTQPIEYRR